MLKSERSSLSEAHPAQVCKPVERVHTIMTDHDPYAKTIDALGKM